MPSTDAVTEQLRARNIHFVYMTYAGAHEWKVWRSSLIDFVPLLFRQMRFVQEHLAKGRVL